VAATAPCAGATASRPLRSAAVATAAKTIPFVTAVRALRLGELIRFGAERGWVALDVEGPVACDA
jgi:hypothetical protein